MATYAEQIAQWRQQRAQQQIVNRCNEIKQEHAQAARERDQAIADNDLETAEFRDADCQQLEQEWRHYNPPRQQVDPRMVEFVRRRTPFVERHGQAAYQAMDMAHQYATRPRNPNTNNPAHTGMGLTPGTQAYFDAMDGLLTMYAKDFGLRYDPEEKLLNANQAAKISGIPAKTYNQEAQKIYQERGFSWQQKR